MDCLALNSTHNQRERKSSTPGKYSHRGFHRSRSRGIAAAVRLVSGPWTHRVIRNTRVRYRARREEEAG